MVLLFLGFFFPQENTQIYFRVDIILVGIRDGLLSYLRLQEHRKLNSYIKQTSLMCHVPMYIEFNPIKVDGLMQCVSGTQSLLSKSLPYIFAGSDFDQFFFQSMCAVADLDVN